MGNLLEGARRIAARAAQVLAEIRRRPTLKEKSAYAVSSVRAFFGKEKNVRLVFRISIAIKGAVAALEVLGGVMLYYVSQQFLLDLVTLATRGELREDPRDFIANFLVHTTQNLSISAQHFTALYLLGHGIIKLFVIAGLLREKLLYYPTAMVVFGLFIAYELYAFALTYSPWLIIVALLDFAVVWLTWREYRYLRNSAPAR